MVTKPGALTAPVVTAFGCVASGNAVNGVNVDIGSVAWTDGGISQNGIGVHIEGTSTTPGSTTEGVRLVGTEIAGNNTIGIEVVGTRPQSTLVLESCNVRDNGRYGVWLAEDGNNNNRTTELLTSTLVHSNGNAATHSGGGIFFSTESNLARFVSNQIFANYGNQITFDQDAPNNDWMLNTVSAANSSCNLASEVYCYDTNGYGVVANHGATVDARFFRFQNEPPSTVTHDFNGNVTAPTLPAQNGYCGNSTPLSCP